jgi:hypothetical protein
MNLNPHISNIFQKPAKLNKEIATCLALVAFLVGMSFQSHAQGPGSGWQYYRVVTLNPVTPAANFQVQVTLSAGQYTHMNSNGSDLRFYDNTDVSCDYWIETWNNTGTSIIWVEVATSGASSLRMYYGNASATAASNGSNTFNFFDDFLGSSLGGDWQQTISNGTVSVSGGQVTLSSNSTNPAGSSYISSPFTPASTSFLIETKHYEPAYNRNRFYASATLFGTNPLGFDNGYFYNGSGASSTAQCFWNGTWNTTVNANTVYLTRWLITDGSTYNWYTLTYSNNTIIDTRTTTYGSNIRYITIGVTEVSGTSTVVDWARVRKYTASEPVSFVMSEVSSSTQMTAYSVSSTFTVPACVTSITVKAWGGGGGGAGTYTPGTDDGGGGGGGGGFRGGTLIVSPGNNISITVGTGGTGGGDDQAGGNGGSSSATHTSGSITAYGGSGGTTGSGSGGIGGTGGGGAFTGSVNSQVSWNGGGGANGTSDNGGGGGGGAGDSQNGVTATSTSGGSGGSANGGNGGAGSTSDAAGGIGLIYGGGGGGASDNGPSTGGKGADGQVIITWTYATPPNFSTSKTDISCFGGTDGSITLTASGGTTPYFYPYSTDGGTNWTGWTQFTNPSGTTQTISPLGAATYTIQLKDNNGCVQTTCSQTL